MGNARIEFKRGTAAFWASENPILHSGEPGYETNTRRFKIGDGNLPWRELPYLTEGSGGAPDTGALEALEIHLEDTTPHPVYDDGPSLYLLYQNAKV